MEEWRAVVGYEGLYEVSNVGKVRSLPHLRTSGIPIKGKELKPQKRLKSGDSHETTEYFRKRTGTGFFIKSTESCRNTTELYFMRLRSAIMGK